MDSSEKRCLYEVLGVHRDCTADEIRSAYRKLALQRHPDKLVKSGVSEAEATASFQELVNAYEVLSDAKERAWYDSHRSQILFSSSNSNNSSPAIVPDLFGFFSNSVFSGYSDKGTGFYKVYSDVFDKIYRNELNFAKKLGLGDVVKEAPLMGNLDSPYAQVNAFYGYWLGFVTVMDFVWADQYDAMAGPNRKSRRLMEEENKKTRKKARREFNDTVRGLAEFVKKRDKRVIDMQVKRNEEIERKKEEERLKKKEMEREKAERARAYEEPEWAKVEDDEISEYEEEIEKKNELYCVACGKKFKSDKQWKNHERSKKHKEKIAALREVFGDEDRENKYTEEVASDKDEFVSADEVHEEVDNLKNPFAGGYENKDYDQESELTEDEENVNVDVDNGGKGRKPVAPFKKAYIEVEDEEVDLMEYNNNKKSRRKKGNQKEKNRTAEEEEEEEKHQNNGNDDHDHDHDQPSSSSQLHSENVDKDDKGDNVPSQSINVSKQAPTKKVANKKETAPKSKNASKGRKQKVGTSKSSSLTCDTCGEDFESRNKLHKHLSDSGHATLKSR
ncbi:hypothetical protein Lser_V15G21648 [Lactuca serriola]